MMNIQLPDDGKKKKSMYWNVCIVLGILSFILIGASGSDDPSGDNVEMEMCGSLLCCGSLIFAISALSTKVDSHKVVVIQQQPQYVPVVQQPVIQQHVYQQPVMQQPVPRPQPQQPVLPSQQDAWKNKAINLERARNWEDAAIAYEKAGLYSEAGRIRQENLEQSQPMVQIGQVGNTVLNDSVMIADNSPKTCSNCGNAVEANWNICPHCSSQL
ncbi:MAG: hypothetical protein CMA11_03030 [Euryarchaeota archaeon]|nr:hypothetical protein [Euryarchaeota archaeon]|tara:strand:- start:1562 stop:2203 length:642 start_codon:yes stop_codon:yes gene_type:complete